MPFIIIIIIIVVVVVIVLLIINNNKADDNNNSNNNNSSNYDDNDNNNDDNNSNDDNGDGIIIITIIITILLFPLFLLTMIFVSLSSLSYIVATIFTYAHVVLFCSLFCFCFWSAGMEVVGPSSRMFAGMAVFFFWCLGAFYLCFFAYFIRNWRNLEIAVSIPAVILLSYNW